MAESEKLTALKKAYAEIILNTAKESAAKVMVAERKAHRYQRELFAAKDEALRLLLRLKQMLDIKISEAETTSLIQQKKIDELEAQLGEAEDIVKDLRAELRELQDELEGITNDQTKPLVEKTLEGDIGAQATEVEENGLSTSGLSVLPAVQSDPVVALGSSTLHAISDGNERYTENGAEEESCFACNPDFDPMVVRKEPELYRNGCTHRIRAFERNLLGPSVQADDTKNQIFNGESEESNLMCKKHISVTDNVCAVEKMKANSIPARVAKSFRRKRKRFTTFRKHKSSSFRSFPGQNDANNVQSGEDSGTTENMVQKDPQSPVAPKAVSDPSEIIMQSGSEGGIEISPGFVKACTFQNMRDNDKLSNELESAAEEDGLAESSQFSDSKTDLDVASSLLANSGPKESDATEALPIQPTNSKFLKYTFRRKRKKESPGSRDGYSALDNINPRTKKGEEQSGSVELPNSCLVTESSRDNWKLAQVAHQLVSLSEKKWQ